MKITHRNVSLVKSAVRIAAGVNLMLGASTFRANYFYAAGSLIVIAELFGILEEMVND